MSFRILRDKKFLLNVVLLPLLFFIIAVSITAFKPEGPELLRYDQFAIQQGEWWRFLTAHFTHSTWNHLLLNMLGLIIMSYLFLHVASWQRWLSIMFFGSLFCSACFYFFAGESYIYVGMSAVLHSVIIAFAILDYKNFKLGSIILLVGTLAKVIWEQSPWYIESSGEFIGGRVATESHFYGAIAGLILGLVFQIWEYFHKPEPADIETANLPSDNSTQS